MNIPIVKRQMDMVLRLAKMSRAKTFLELGCGSGHNAKIMSENGFSGEGIDSSHEAISLAKQKDIRNVIFTENDIFKTKFEPKELVLMLFVLEHIEEDELALRKVRSFIKDNGHLIMSVPAHGSSYSNQDKLAGHFRRYDRAHIRKLLKDTGFDTRKIYCIGFPISNIYTFVYNLYLKTTNKGKVIVPENTELTGVKKNQNIPKIARLLSKIAFPIFSILIRLDCLFLDTDLGTHYVILAKAYK